MTSFDDVTDTIQQGAPPGRQWRALVRTGTNYNPLSTFDLSKGKHYQQQYADMYFARLAQLKPAVESVAGEVYGDFELANERARRVDRVLDVRQGDLCWVVGTVYMEMPLKPNVLDDIGKEHWIAAPPPREKYVSESAQISMMLEDESGRLQLTGHYLKTVLLVTGTIVAALGTENADGDFEVLDLQFPGLPRQPTRWERDDGDAAVNGSKLARPTPSKVAIVSGLAVSGDDGDNLHLDLLQEWLLGELASEEDQSSSVGISRLIIAGNSLAHSAPIPSREDFANIKKAGQRKYGYDSTSYKAAPAEQFDTWIAKLLPALPVTLLPGDQDPSSTALPQQPIHPALFPQSRGYMEIGPYASPGWFDSVTNPAEFDCEGWRFLATGGQTLDDVYRYVLGDERLEMMEAMLRWRLAAPTAPDTLWCFPSQDGDSFVLKECPHVYVVGNQPKFETGIIHGDQDQKVRLIAVPKFKETGQLVVLDLETLSTEIIHFAAFGGE